MDVEQLERVITTVEAQRTLLGDAVVDTLTDLAREKLALLAAQPPVVAEQQRKQVTVLFADVSGFTAMAELMDAEDVAELMNALWQRIDIAILSQGGMIDKHIGDGVMALWGRQAAREDDPERAVQAARDRPCSLRLLAGAIPCHFRWSCAWSCSAMTPWPGWSPACCAIRRTCRRRSAR